MGDNGRAARGANPDYDDDLVLIDALRAGDEAAFAWLVGRHDRALRRIAASFVSDRAVVDEVVQETWLGVIRGIDRFEGRSSVKTWLYRILMNIARSHGVKEARTRPFTAAGLGAIGGNGAADVDGYTGAFAPDRFRGADDAWPGHWAAPPPRWSDAPEVALNASETLDRVRAAVAALPRQQRIVVSLRDIDGCSAAEVCALLEIGAENQRVLLHRGRAKVRSALEPYVEGLRV